MSLRAADAVNDDIVGETACRSGAGLLRNEADDATFFSVGVD
jgi:hypothetical protein